jgi:predicted nucleotidyltransferase
MKRANSKGIEKTIKETVFKFLNPRKHRVFIFGSRATGRANKFSDYDIGILSKKPLPFDRLAFIEEAFEESNLPFRVDIIDFSLVSPRFRKIALAKFKRL